MSLWLKQSTAVILKMGPFVDDDDGTTLKDGLTIAQADIQISKNGAAFAQTSAASPTTTYDADGWYPIPLTTTDTGTLGTLKVQVAMADTLPVWQECMVVPANVWDSFFGADTLQADITQVTGNAVVATGINGALKVDVHAWNGTAIPGVDTAGYPKVTIKSGIGDGELTIAGGITDANTVEWDGAALPELAETADIWSYATRTLSAPTNITTSGYAIETSAADNRVYVTETGHTSGCTVAAVTGNVGGSVASVTGAVGSVTGAVGSVTGNVGGNVTGSVGSVAAGGIAAASIASSAITNAKFAAGAIDSDAIATSGAEKIADTLLDRDMSTGADSGSTTVRTPRQALRMLRNKWGISAGTLTVYKEDDATSSWTGAVTTTAGNPVTAVNPAGGS